MSAESSPSNVGRLHVCQLQNAKNITYALSQQPWYEYAGGWAKFASVQEFPYSSLISGSLVELKPGGLRELHWHAPNEWAIVINGTCRFGQSHEAVDLDRCMGIWQVFSVALGSGHQLP